MSACPGVTAVRFGSLPHQARSGHGSPAVYKTVESHRAGRGPPWTAVLPFVRSRRENSFVEADSSWTSLMRPEGQHK